MNTKAVKEFVENYINQDNRYTAWPYAYVIQKKVQKPIPEGYGGEKRYHLTDYEYYDYESKEELIKELRENCWTKEELENIKNTIEQTEIAYEWEDVQWFFTEKEANNYLNRNKHNLPETRTFVNHFYRNSEAELILRTMFELAGYDYDKESRYKMNTKDRAEALAVTFDMEKAIQQGKLGIIESHIASLPDKNDKEYGRKCQELAYHLREYIYNEAHNAAVENAERALDGMKLDLGKMLCANEYNNNEEIFEHGFNELLTQAYIILRKLKKEV